MTNDLENKDKDLIAEESKLTALLSQIQAKGSLPALEANVIKISSLCRKSNTRAADLAAVIMRDSALATNLLATINSVLYRPRMPVQTVSSAVVLLGFEKVQALALRLSLFDQQRRTTKNNTLYRLLLHSYFTGTFAMTLSRIAGFRNPEEAFVAGLLNQLPHQVLANAFPDHYSEMEKRILSGTPIRQACFKVFEVNHDELCHAIVMSWNLPDNISQLILRIGGFKNPIFPYLKEAIAISDLIFHDHTNKASAFGTVQERLRDLLKNTRFSIYEFIKFSCKKDENILRFFNLDDDDIDRMVSVLKDGSFDPSMLIDRSQAAGKRRTIQNTPQARDSILQKFLKEIQQFTRDIKDGLEGGDDEQQMLKLGHEAIYDLLEPSHLFAATIDREDFEIKGCFYLGSDATVQGHDFFLDLLAKDSPIAKCAIERKTKLCRSYEENLRLDPSLLLKLKLDHILIAPVQSKNRVSALFFIGRSDDRSFSKIEQQMINTVIKNMEKRLKNQSKF